MSETTIAENCLPVNCHLGSVIRACKKTPKPKSCPLCRYALYPNSGLCTNSACPNHEDTNCAQSSVISAAELFQKYESPRIYHGRQWGDWRLNGHNFTLAYFPGGRWTYEIDLKDVHDSASLLDWIFQVSSKLWADAGTTRDLLNALEDIFSPQANLCSGGFNKTISPDFLRERLREKAA